MKKILILLVLVAFIKDSTAQFTLSPEAAENYYLNPIISGMNPDPSICRVGEDYYLITSTFGFFPGIPIYHSKDLVNWRLIGHGINRASQFKIKENEGLNIYAATIRYNKGTFYIISTQTGKKGDSNFVITASNPEGPWSEAHWIPTAKRIDPSLFFDDDGKVYYTGNYAPKSRIVEKGRYIWIQEINPKTWHLVGEKVDILIPDEYYKGLILSGQTNNHLNFFEGPHTYKKDGEYYLLVSHGGTFWDHAVSIWKSKNIFGPYEMNLINPIATNRDYSHDAYLHHTGHADMVQTQNNEWWMVMLACRPYGGEYTNLGRETCLVPVDWSGDWPIVNPLGPVGRVKAIHRKPNLPIHTWPKEDIRDDFDAKKLKLYWNFIQTPNEEWWDLNKPSGKLQIKLRPEIITKGVNPSFIGRRQAHKNFTAITKMDFTPQTENETAGMVITRDVSNQFQILCIIKNGQKYIRLVRKDVVNKTEAIISELPVKSKTVYIKAEALEQMFSFSFSADGTSWELLAANENGSFLSNAVGTGRFTGVFVGMYASSNGKESTNSALFDWFEYSGY